MALRPIATHLLVHRRAEQHVAEAPLGHAEPRHPGGLLHRGATDDEETVLAAGYGGVLGFLG